VVVDLEHASEAELKGAGVVEDAIDLPVLDTDEGGE
jgi:hypothetical protein